MNNDKIVSIILKMAAEIFFDKLACIRYCACDKQLIFINCMNTELFVMSYPNDDIIYEKDYVCDDCGKTVYMCNECYIPTADICEDCYEKEQKDFEEEYKCSYCAEVNIDTFWCEVCDSYVCEEHLYKCPGCSLKVCIGCHENGEGCTETHE